MARRRRGEDIAPAGPVVPGEAEAAPRIHVRMEGTADQIKEQLGVTGEEPAVPKGQEEVEDTRKKFVAALRNPRYQLKVKRQTPREFNGVKTNVELFGPSGLELPMTYQEIQQVTEVEGGGGKYRLAIVDPHSNDIVAADTLTIEGDPIVADLMSPELTNKLLMQGEPKTPTEVSEEALDRRARTTAKMIELQSLQQQLDDLKQKGRPAANDGNSTRIDELERRLIEAKHQAELERIQRDNDRKLDELKASMLKMQAPQQNAGSSEVALILKQMQMNQAAADVRFSELLKTMQDDKMNAVLRELQVIKNKPAAEGGGMIETFKMFRSMAEMMGMDLPGEKGGDDGDDVDPDAPWYEQLASKYLPKILNFFEAKSDRGEKVSRDEVMAQINAAAKQAEEEAVQNAIRRAAPNSDPSRLPPPPPRMALVPPPPALVRQQSPQAVSELPPPPPLTPTESVSVLDAPSQQVQQAQQQPGLPSIQQEIVIRVAGVLQMIDRESQLRPNEYMWNYEGCWKALPEFVLEKVCSAADVPSMIDVFLVEGMDQAAVGVLKEKISTNPRALAWLSVGLTELKEWWAGKLADPTFDPFADDGEDEVGEGT